MILITNNSILTWLETGWNILLGGLIRSNLSLIPPNPRQD